MITIELESDVVRLGEELVGSMTWSAPARAPKAVAATLRWYTEGRGDQDRAEVVTARQDLEGPSAGLTSFPFRLRVPGDSPVSYDGMMIRLRWEIDAELDIPWGRNEHHQADVWVLPR